MGLLEFVALAALTVARHGVYDDLADRARSQPPEFAADALLRIAEAPNFTDVAWKRRVLEDAFHLAAQAQEPFARRNWKGSPGTLFDKAYAQGLDACTLQCKAVHAMLAIDYKKARELFAEIPPPRIPQLTCDDTLAADVSIFYATAGEVAARAFNAKEVAEEEPFHLLQRYAADATAPAQVRPIANMLSSASLPAAQFEALVDSLAGTLTRISGDDRSFSALMSGGAEAAITNLAAECTRRKINAQPLTEAWRGFVKQQLAATRCPDAPPAECQSPECRRLSAQFSTLVMAPNGFGLTPEQKATAEWKAKLHLYLAAMAEWTRDDDPVEYFRFKSRFYSELFNLTPSGPERDLVLSTLLSWLQTNGYQRDHRAEWFYPVNALIIQAFADPAGMHTTVRELRRTADPVIALYAQLEQLLPRPTAASIGLL